MRASVGAAELEPHLYVRSDSEAVHHLFRVASSLDSLVIGEPQILGQVKTTHDLALKSGTAGPILNLCFSRAFRVARRVRRETAIARNPVSVSSVAIDLARQVFGGFDGRRVLIVGAGKMSDLAARALQGQGAALTVTNRTPGRAQELAARMGGDVHAWEDLVGALAAADIVLASTGAREPVLTRALVAKAQKLRRGRPLFLIDIAVPRDVEPSCGELQGIYLADIDDLQKVAEQPPRRPARRGRAGGEHRRAGARPFHRELPRPPGRAHRRGAARARADAGEDRGREAGQRHASPGRARSARDPRSSRSRSRTSCCTRRRWR